MMFRSKPSEESLLVSVRFELAENLADLEGRHLEYRRRLASKEEAHSTLENAEAEVRRLHSESIALQKGFWEAYYRNGQDTQTEVGPESRSLQRAIEKAEKSLKRARARWEEADFDEVAEWSALTAKAEAVKKEAMYQVDALEEALGDLIIELRHDLKEAVRALHDDECLDTQEVRALKLAKNLRTQVQSSSAGMMSIVSNLLQGKPGRRNLLIAAFFPLLVGLLSVWVGLFEIKGEVLLALTLVGLGFVNVVAAALYILPTGRWRSVPGELIAGISVVLLVIGTAARGLLI
jgi:hypothetical protein